MSTASETERSHAVSRPVSRAVRLRRNPVGRFVWKLPFWILIALIFIYALFPFYWALRSAFTPAGQLFDTPIQYIPHHPTLQNFRDVLSSSLFRRALLNSTIVAGSVTLISLAVGSVAAYALGRFNFRGKSSILYLMLSMTIFPQIAIVGALYTMFTGFHVVGPFDFPKLYDTEWALIFSYLIFTIPFTIWVLTGFMRALPADLEEAAYVDGATPLQVFYKVLLPLIAPGLVTTAYSPSSRPGTSFSSRFRSSRAPASTPCRSRSPPSPERAATPSRPLGAIDGRDRGRHRAADRRHPAAAETDPGGANRRCRQGLDRVTGLRVEEIEPGRIDSELDLAALGDPRLRADAATSRVDGRVLRVGSEGDVGVVAGIGRGGAGDDPFGPGVEVDEHLGASGSVRSQTTFSRRSGGASTRASRPRNLRAGSPG